MTLKIAAVSTTVAAVVGMPLGLLLGLGSFRGRRFGQTILLGLILVVVGALTFLQHRDGAARLDKRVA